MSENEEAVAEKIQAMLEVMWKNSTATVAERVSMVRRAQQKLAQGTLDTVVRKEAESAAHKLAGILGTFGLPEGSALASKIERLLAREGAVSKHQEQELAEWLDKLEREIATRG